jgi:hypothetical protein
MGPVQLLHGKDLSAVATVIGTGGVFAYGRHPRRMLEAACYSPESPTSLCHLTIAEDVCDVI